MNHLEKISIIENNIDEFLNSDNHYGTFYVGETLEEMARVGKVPHTKYEIHIEGSEGYTPHMHICIKSGKDVVLRIELLDNKYFREKDDKCNTLNTSERKALDEYLSELADKNYKINNWEYMCMTWNRYNPAHEIDLSKNSKPNYTIINEP